MNALFDYGEFLICIGPIFLIMATIGLTLLWNAIPAQKEKPSKRPARERKDDD